MPRFFIIFLLLFFCDFSFAQEAVQEVAYKSDEVAKKPRTKPAKEAPTKIRSDIMDIKRKSQTVNFIGNVVIEKQDSSLLSQKMTILYNEEKEKKGANKNTSENSTEEQPQQKKSSIKKIYTDEKVKIFGEDFVATGDSGYYEPQADIFVLEKNVMVNNGVSVAKGDKFIHHISTKKSNFVGQKKEDNAEDKRVVVILGDDAKEFKKSKKKNEQEIKR